MGKGKGVEGTERKVVKEGNTRKVEGIKGEGD